ncbi:MULTISPECIES: cbb3-type cytochrome c oxidase subunit 3 [Iodidimonas]|jgi:cytochrome c oxidase cbb3-type subunit 4|uniref:Cytochrome oxidase n=1 Tax=Iodidimonas nitroreducens TaxID=1236968 RepID=A0A5A7NBW3_9PROT|nr:MULTISPECIES: cbb3-type cytochrome c oxidase subunit 3 [Iodidimonas]GAK33098.1 cbb3-type cytochrome oxidase, subunit 3 [alpha proteobacterium Q-1]GER05105.1 hypothetical protein JCM17846_27870 [Iodidimonas nitroreducens]
MYEALSNIAGTWGLLFLLVLFIAVLGYALWPRNKDKFDHASRLPLSDEPPEDFGTGKKAPGARPTDKDQRS